MQIKKLFLQNFRNYERENFEFSGGLNVLFGKNAQGKTNCAEAVFYLCTGTSLRIRHDKQLIRMGADMDAPEYDGDEARLGGTCTAAAFWDYPQKFAATTRGHGRIASRYSHHAPCKNQDAIVSEIGYSALADVANPPGSVFCSHGAGYYVAWDEVRSHAHCEIEE